MEDEPVAEPPSRALALWSNSGRRGIATAAIASTAIALLATLLLRRRRS